MERVGGVKAKGEGGAAERAAPSVRSPGLAPAPQTPDYAELDRYLKTGVIRAKLTVSQPGDPEEREADAMADAFIQRTTAGSGQSSGSAPPCSCGGTCPVCAGKIRRKPSSQHLTPNTQHPVPALGPSSPLPASVRDYFEPHFGQDFSGVPIHTGPEANAAAESFGARAFAYDGAIAFRQGEYAPETEAGKRLLAHELTHIAQSGAANSLRRDTDGGVPGAGVADSARTDAGDSAASGPSIFVFEGIRLSEDESFVRQQVTERIRESKDPFFGEGLLARLERADSSTTTAERQRARDQETEGGLPGGVAWSPQELLDFEALLGAKTRLIPVLRNVNRRIAEERAEFVAQFEAQARINLGSMLDESLARVNSERERYGLQRTFTTRTRVHASGEGPRETVQESVQHDSMRQTGGMSAAAAALAAKARQYRALVSERFGVLTPSGGENDSPSPAEQARYTALTGQIEQSRQEYNELRNRHETDYPILGPFTELPGPLEGTYFIDRTISGLDLIAAGPSQNLAERLNDQIDEKSRNIASVWTALNEGALAVWQLPPIIDLTRFGMQTQENSLEDAFVASRLRQAEREAHDQAITQIALSLLALGLGLLAALPSGGSSLVAAGTFVAAAGAAGAGAYLAYEHLQEYALESAKSGSDFVRARAISQEEPSLFWLALDIVGVLFDIHAAVTAFRALRSAIALQRAARTAEETAAAEARIAQHLRENSLPEEMMTRIRQRLLQGESAEEGLAQWERTLNPETHAALVDNPTVRAVYAEMDDEVRSVLSHCASVCILPNVTRRDAAAVRQLLDRLRANGVAFTEDIQLQLKIYFHVHGGDMTGALRMLEQVKTAEELERKVIQAFRSRARFPVGPVTPRTVAGTAQGGTNLPFVASGENWLRGIHKGRAGLVPRQIADQMRNLPFNNFDEFRETFWRLVSQDTTLSTQFTRSNPGRIADGLAPFGLEGGYQLHHITPLEHGGALYDLDNIAVVTDQYHHFIHDPIVPHR